MLTDDQLGQRLAVHMRAEVAGIDSDPGWAGTLRRRHARRRAAIGAATAVPVIAVVVAASLLAGAALEHPAGPPTPGPATAADLHDAAYVTARTTAALSDLSRYVEQATTTTSNGTVAVSQIDWTTGRSRTDTRAANGSRMSTLGTLHDRPVAIDYTTRTWWMLPPPPTPRALDSPTGPTPPAASTPGSATGPKVEPFTDPAQIKAAITRDQLRVVGAERVDGHRTLHLRDTRFTRFDLWVDASSYLPVRLSIGTGTNAQVEHFAWLDRTPERLAGLTVAVPAGFTERKIP